MKKKVFKRTKLVALIMLLALTLSAVTFTNVSAANDTKQMRYEIRILTHSGLYTGTDDDIWVNIHDLYGKETGWMNIGSKTEKDVWVTGKEIGNNTSRMPAYVEVKVDGSDGLYPDTIYITPEGAEKPYMIFGGAWVDNGETVRFDLKANSSYLMFVNTADVSYAGTDRNVYATLVDENGVRSARTNLTEITGALNCFERDSRHRYWIHVPEEFGDLHHIVFELSGGSSVASGWKLGSVEVILTNQFKTIEVNQWGDKGQPITVYI